MAHSRLLLLLIGAAVTHLPQVHAGPLDFWCNTDSRQSLMESFNDMGSCPDLLPSPLPVPCTGLNLLHWRNKTEKQAEVLEDFQVLQDGIQDVSNQSSSGCQPSLKDIQINISQYVKIISRALKQSGAAAAPPASIQTCGEKRRLGEVWDVYRRLVNGKLEELAKDMSEALCSRRRRSLRKL
ncbi:thrombopoietin isoform X2 [Cyprinodon tularosa]|uniref:thrombopoietin isoform X2 n=1 Tax=Cyprinodon tularosa TaxID=77115 RepID=UPI0018E20CCB|nr:thrombopoietin isoform X2 [Cyprinodon tularosa]